MSAPAEFVLLTVTWKRRRISIIVTREAAEGAQCAWYDYAVQRERLRQGRCTPPDKLAEPTHEVVARGGTTYGIDLRAVRWISVAPVAADALGFADAIEGPGAKAP